MFDPAFWALFFAAALVINLTPGPDMLYLLGKSCVQGRRIGLWAAAGLWCGTLFHVSAAAVGLSALLVASSTLFTLLGAAYLCWLDRLLGAMFIGLGVRLLSAGQRS
ncbi:LysE family translocator [Halotalea alkalilenta]|uniref:Lysine transporter LysE n=1 Tax=Halotalea alkalilenta TaxID=376489 RepID=A0A172YCU9_9GAMM|nr:LysE family transporter [Halotalea alkalilenta]ANF57079.1 hypothetical protein A5892_06040 [Halotalea alkalilenta]